MRLEVDNGARMQISRQVLLAIVAIAVLLLFVDVHLESYESIFSVLVSGVYTDPCVDDWFNDVHFILLALYARLNQVFPVVQVYGLMLFLSTVFALVISWVAISHSAVVRQIEYYFLFFVLFCAIASDNLQNLSSDRAAFFLAAGSIGLGEVFRLRRGRIPRRFWCFAVPVILFACLLRFEVVLLCSFCYGVLIIVTGQAHKAAVIPFVISLAMFVIFNLLIDSYASEPRKVFFYKELQFVDRNDIDYGRLDESTRQDVDALKKYLLFDNVHFNLEFYDRVSRTKYRNDNITKLFDGVGFESFRDNLSNTLFQVFPGMHWAVFGLLGWVVVVYSLRRKFRMLILGLLFFLSLPVILSAYVIVPDRFLMPYFSSMFVLSFVFMLMHGVPKFKWLMLSAVLLLILAGLTNIKKEKRYDSEAVIYEKTIQKLDSLIENAPEASEIVVCNSDIVRYFSADPFRNNTYRPVSFLNFYYFGSFECYISSWKNRCRCDPFSLPDKIRYVADSQSYFIVHSEVLAFMQKYLQDKYQVRLEAELLEPFDAELNIYRLSYPAPAAP